MFIILALSNSELKLNIKLIGLIVIIIFCFLKYLFKSSDKDKK